MCHYYSLDLLCALAVKEEILQLIHSLYTYNVIQSLAYASAILLVLEELTLFVAFS